MWADDQWLVEHAGATLKQTNEEEADGDEADSAAEKHTEADTETVSNSCLLCCSRAVEHRVRGTDNGTVISRFWLLTRLA